MCLSNPKKSKMIKAMSYQERLRGYEKDKQILYQSKILTTEEIPIKLKALRDKWFI